MRQLTVLLAVLLAGLAFAGTANAAKPAPGTYTGKTSHDLRATLKVGAAGKVKSLKFLVKNSCGATRKEIEVTGPFPVRRDGRFRASLANENGTLKFSGRFRARGRVTGTLRERTKDDLLGDCDTGRVTFAARRR